ncbi:ankyrin repeat domain-containing protein [Spirosoma sp. BT702]|uniref:Ankyrin repeat domain-containing protein n=1 Tax=Spirosoma profusum TaxID=2771354 RepID=A0A926Y1W1_9BACT|nr:ankyrin repeat domain-containing protein [Spirosoma profusum]MBD2700356.1 ankyrin repeat domain-containing protein [Spirosoma profusum]
MLKIVTIVNWLAIAILGVLLAISYVFPTKGGDAAGRGMGEAILLFASIAFGVLLILNLLPFNWARYSAFSLLMLPVAFLVLNGVAKPVKDIVSAITYSKSDYDGSDYFSDKQCKAILSAIYDEDVVNVETLLREPVPHINDLDIQGEMTILDYTASHYSPYKQGWKKTRRIMELLIKAGATINSTNPKRTATHTTSVWNAPPYMLEFFLKRGADPNAIGENHVPILYHAIRAGGEDSIDKVKLLLDYGADCNVVETYDRYTENFSPVIFASSFGYWDVCWLLIQRGADKHYVAPNGSSVKSYVQYFEKEYKERNEQLPATFYHIKASVQP